VTDECKATNVAKCHGRNPASYRDLVSTALFQLAEDPSLRAGAGQAQQASQRMHDFAKDALGRAPTQENLAAITDEGKRRQVFELARQAGAADAAHSTAYLDAFSKVGIENLATLIDNQPQFAITANWHERGQFSGPREGSATIEYQVGRKRLGNICGVTAFATCLDAALRDERISSVLSDKFVFSASFKRVERYQIDDLGDIAAAGFTPVDLPRATEWKAKAQWGRKLGMRVTGERPRVDVSGEFLRQAEGGDRKQNRLVATATFTMPFRENMSFPISVSYANKPDFLTDSRKKLGMHFGISYRLPWERTNGQ
jgi:hypothetical protein